jgi:hypothetical protein
MVSPVRLARNSLHDPWKQFVLNHFSLPRNLSLKLFRYSFVGGTDMSDEAQTPEATPNAVPPKSPLVLQPEPSNPVRRLDTNPADSNRS